MRAQRNRIGLYTLSSAQLLQIYLWGAMALLLVQGSGSLLLRLRPDIEAVTPLPLATLMNGDIRHALLHITWGLFGLVYLVLLRTLRARLWLAFTFGFFYVFLGLLALVVYHPFGMRLELPEDVFHLTVGPLMLLLAFSARSSPEMLVWPALLQRLKPG
jgi:hypothetical protein